VNKTSTPKTNRCSHRERRSGLAEKPRHESFFHFVYPDIGFIHPGGMPDNSPAIYRRVEQ
jgi:hypothetical protein